MLISEDRRVLPAAWCSGVKQSWLCLLHSYTVGKTYCCVIVTLYLNNVKEIVNATNLRHNIKFGNSIRVWNKSKACSSIHNLCYICSFEFMHQVSQDRKYCAASKETSECVECGYNHGIPVTERVSTIEKQTALLPSISTSL